MDALVAIGTSAGGLAALRALIGGLPADFPAPVCVVQHLGHHSSELADLLAQDAALPVVWAEQGMPLQPGIVYVAPPDHHLLVAGDAIELTHGPRENFARPAIDPLFRSVAVAFGPRGIGVVLTGRLGDGTAGMYEIKRHGGVVIVQDPLEAEFGEMPRNVLAHVEVDHCAALATIPRLLMQLVAAAAGQHGDRREHEQESAMVRQKPLGEIASFVCPECGGAMQQEQLGTLGLFTCHIGHKLTTESLVYAQRSKLEQSAELLVRELHEHAAMCRRIAAEATEAAVAQRWEDAARDADQRLEIVRMTFDTAWHM